MNSFASEHVVWIYLMIIFPLLFFICVGIIVYYAEPNFPAHSYVTIFIGYFIAFNIVTSVPIDIATVVVNRRSTTDPSTYTQDVGILSDNYTISFEMILIMGTLLLPYLEYYNSDGYFTFFDRCWSALKRMCRIYMYGIIAALILLPIVLFSGMSSSGDQAMLLAATVVTDIIYETFLCVLLGYGIVEFPRRLWTNSSIAERKMRVQMKAAADYARIEEYRHNCAIQVANAFKTRDHLPKNADPDLKKCMDTVLADCPPDFRTAGSGEVAYDKDTNITKHSLAGLRMNLKAAKVMYKMAQSKLEQTKMTFYQLEDLVAATEDPEKKIYDNVNKEIIVGWGYQWEINIKPVLGKIFAVCCACLSILSGVGVIGSMSGVPALSSPYFLIVHNQRANTYAIVIFIIITLGYTVYVTMWALFQMQIPGVLPDLVPFKTTAESLSFNCRMCLRLAAPLSFFYLGWLGENGLKDGDWSYHPYPAVQPEHKSFTWFYYNGTANKFENITKHFEVPVSEIKMSSAFSNFYQLQSIAVVKTSFGTIFPVLFFTIVVLILPNFLNRFFLLINMPNYQFGYKLPQDDELAAGLKNLQKDKKVTLNKYRREGFRKRLSVQLKSMSGANVKQSGCRNVCGRLVSFMADCIQGRCCDSVFKEKEELDIGQQFQEQFKPAVPEVISGMIEKAGKSFFGRSKTWNTVYAVVRIPGELHIFRDESASQDPDSISEVIELKRVLHFVVKVEKNQLKLDLGGGDAVKLRMENPEKVCLWEMRLKAWKIYAVDDAMFGTGGGIESANDQKGSPWGGQDDSASDATLNPLNKGTDNSGNGESSKRFKLRWGKNKNKNKNSVDKESYEPNIDDVVIPTDDDLEIQLTEVAPKPTTETPKTRGGFVGEAFSSASTATANFKRAIADSYDIYSNNGKPKQVEGFVEKKGVGRWGAKWQRRYLRIDERSSLLCYFESDNPNESCKGSINFIDIGKIVSHKDKKGDSAEALRFNIEMNDRTGRTYKFRALNKVDYDMWMKALNDWRDHAAMEQYT